MEYGILENAKFVSLHVKKCDGRVLIDVAVCTMLG